MSKQPCRGTHREIYGDLPILAGPHQWAVEWDEKKAEFSTVLVRTPDNRTSMAIKNLWKPFYETKSKTPYEHTISLARCG